MLQCVVVYCSVLQCVAVCRSDMDVYSSYVLECSTGVAVCCSLLQFVAVCCSVLQCVVLQCVSCYRSHM